ncbi:MAG: DUF58 domain-containing protein [Lachnospiraceae bacterium]
MIKRRIIYLVILAVSFWIMLMYDGVFMEGIFAVTVFLPVVCIIIKYITIYSVYVNWTSDSIKTEQGKAINVMAVLHNHFFLPVSRAAIIFEVEDPLGNKEEYKMVTNLMPHMERYCQVEMSPNYSGAFLVRLKAVKIYDILGLTWGKKKVGSVLMLMVYPKPCEGITVTVENNIGYKEESDEYSEHISGSDKSQIFDINTYQLGDSIKDVHWKLSSKTDNLMVKRYSYPIERRINVFIDYGIPEGRQITAAGVSGFFDRLYSFLGELEKNNESVCIYAFTGNSDECLHINKEDILYLNINNSSYVHTVCETFMKEAFTGSNILISSRITKEELYDYGDLSDCYINWNELWMDKENNPQEIFIQKTGIIGINMEAFEEERKPMASYGDELYINKDNEDIGLYTHVFRILLVLLGSIIPMLIFYDVLVVYKSTPIKVIAFPALAVILMLISTFIKNRGIKTLYLTGALWGVVFLLGINNIIDGGAKAVKAFGNPMLYYNEGYGLSLSYNSEIESFVAFTALIYAVLLFMFTWNSITVIIHIILTISPIALCLAYGCVPDSLCTVMYISYIGSVFVYSITYKNIVKPEKRVLKKAFYESTINIGAILSYTVMAIIAAIMVIDAAKGYHRPDMLSSMKAEINSYIENFSFNRKKINDDTAVGGLSNGSLGAVNKVKYSGETVLTVNVSGDLSFPLYLRGYIGSEYTGSSWEVISDGKDKEMENRLEGTGLGLHSAYNLPYYIMRRNMEVIEMTRLGRVSYGNVTVENMSESDSTYYIPYGAFIAPDVVVIKDGVILNNVYGQRNYNVYQLQGIFNLLEYLNNDYGSESTNYSMQENEYRNIAYEYYSEYDGDNEIRERLRREMPWKYTIDGVVYNLNDGPKNIGYEPYIQAVQDYLSKNYTYSLSPGKLKAGQDFIEKFMDDKRGYCSHFATIATEMFRIYGIPARYVEGYYVKPQPVELIEYYKNKLISVEVKDDSAHAWTEIYIDGLGFIPVEATPGYTGIRYEYQEETSTEPVTSNNTPTSSTREEDSTTAPPVETTSVEPSSTTTKAYEAQESEGVKPFGFMENKYIAAVIIAAAIVAVILGRKSHYDRKNEELVRKRPSKEALMWEEQLVRMARSIKPSLILLNENTRYELAAVIIKYIDERKRHKNNLTEKEIEEMFLIFDKAVYSEGGADREEMNKAAETAADILEELYINQHMIRRIVIRYIKCLYLK